MPTSAAGSRRSAEHGFTSLRRSAERGFTSRWRSAEHGFTSRWRSAEHGFTLVELMVVVTVIGLASAIAVWAMPDPRGRVLDEGLRFAARVRAARDLAVVDAAPVSLWVTSGGYGFDRRTGGAWVPLAEKPLRVERWSDGTRAQTGEASVGNGGRTRVTFDPTGTADRGIDVRLDRGGVAALVRIDATGQVRADAQ